jgi:hypothetical protein
MEAMTRNNKKERDALLRLADLLAEDILNTPDDEILAEFRANGDPDQNAAATRALFEKTVIAMNKQRLAAARAAVANNRRAGGQSSPASVDIAEARRLLHRVQASSVDRPVTLAARKETELSDADVLSIVANLKELGVIPPDDSEGP